MQIAQTVQVVATTKYLRVFGLALCQTNKQKTQKTILRVLGLALMPQTGLYQLK